MRTLKQNEKKRNMKTSNFADSFNAAGKLSPCITAQGYTLQIPENTTWQNTLFCLFMNFFLHIIFGDTVSN